MMKVSEICDKLGRRHLAERLGVGLTAVGNAAVAEIFPAKWYSVVKGMCLEAHIDCREDQFSFLSPVADAKPEPLKAAS